MPEETFKYNADFSQIKREIDETTAKVNKLGDRLDEVGSKFGSSSPQATMVKHALDRAMAELDKKIAALEKLNNQKPGSSGSSATGKGDKSRSSADEDLERRYKRESDMKKLTEKNLKIYLKVLREKVVYLIHKQSVVLSI
jgi:phage-related minor tail protein